MSYSRWSNSTWYTYWCVQDKETENRDTAIFEICGEQNFTAKELRDDLYACLSMVVLDCTVAPTSDELGELRGYMLAFLADVDAAYPTETTHAD